MNYNTQMINNQNHSTHPELDSRHSVLDTESKTPKLRFPKFSMEWEEKKLIDLSENGFSNGAFNDPKKVGYGYRIINVKDMYVDGTINVDNLTRVGLDEKEFSKNRVEYGDVFFTRSSLVKEGIAYSNVNLNHANDLTFDGHLIRMRPIKEQYLPIFLYYNFTTKNARKQFIVRGKTTTMTTIGQEDIASVVITLPKFPEQTKIASFLSAIDTKIDQLTKKQTLLKQYKKGVMQKLFSQELRFKADDGSEFPEWEEKTLGEICNFTNGKAHENDIVENGRFIVVNSKFISTNGMVKKYSDKQILPLKKDDIVMVMSDVPKGKALGKCFLIDVDNQYTLNQRICCLQGREVYNPFLIYLISRNRYYLAFDSGVGQTNLKKEDVLNCPVYIPTSLLEQIKIANFLTSIDTKIDFVAKQLDVAKNFKKGLLQQMFV